MQSGQTRRWARAQMTLVGAKYKHYLLDVGLYIGNAQKKPRRDRLAKEDPDRSFEAGRVLACYEVISIPQQSAAGFDIALDKISLQNLDPDRDLHWLRDPQMRRTKVGGARPAAGTLSAPRADLARRARN